MNNIVDQGNTERNLLVIDDQLPFREYIKALVQILKLPIDITCVATEADARECLSSTEFQLIFLNQRLRSNIRIPNNDGTIYYVIDESGARLFETALNRGFGSNSPERFVGFSADWKDIPVNKKPEKNFNIASLEDIESLLRERFNLPKPAESDSEQ